MDTSLFPIKDSLKFNIRMDGRKRFEKRNLYYNTSKAIIPNSSGACKLEINDDNLEIYISTKLELFNSKNNDQINIRDLILIEINTNIENQLTIKYKNELKQIINTIKFYIIKYLIDIIDIKILKINDQFYYKIYVDIFCIGDIDIFHIEKLLNAIVITLKDTEIPNICINKNKINEQITFEIDNNNIMNKLFKNINFPNYYLIGYYDNSIIIDLTKDEYNNADANFLLSILNINGTYKLSKFEKICGKLIDLNNIGKILDIVSNNLEVLYNN